MKDKSIKAKTDDVAGAALALLGRLDRLTTNQFSLGAERVEREALRRALASRMSDPGAQRERWVAAFDQRWLILSHVVSAVGMYLSGFFIGWGLGG